MMKTFSKKYLEILNDQLAGLNLTRITSDDDFYNKQVVDSVRPFEDSAVLRKSLNDSGLLVDIGFGGGFPILPVAYLNPDVSCIGLEARGKKSKAVNLIAELIALSNVKTYHQRFEQVLFDVDCTITFKAVGKVEDLLDKFICTEKIQVFFYKGPNFYELENLNRILKNWRIVEEIKFDVPGTDGRLLIGFQPKNVPRGTGREDKNLVKLSDLI